MESFVGNHSGLYSDWIATSSTAGKSPPRRRLSPTRRRRKKPPLAAEEPRKGSHIMDRHVNRHSREAIKVEVEARRAQMNRKADNVLLGSTVMKRRELAQLQKDSGFGTAELRAVMESFKAHSSYDATHNSVNREHFAAIMSDVFEHMTPDMSNRLFESMDGGERSQRAYLSAVTPPLGSHDAHLYVFVRVFFVCYKMVLGWWTTVSWSKAVQSLCMMVRARPNTHRTHRSTKPQPRAYCSAVESFKRNHFLGLLL